MKNLGKLGRPLATVLVTAIAAGISPVSANEEVRLPTATEIREIKAEYEKTFGMNLKHVHIFYDDPRLSNKGPVGSIRTEKLNACGVVVNSKDLQAYYALSFMKGAPSQEVARKFLVAHELTHCLFTREDSMRNLKSLGLDVKNEAHSQETIADLVGVTFIIRQGQGSDQLLTWLQEKRSGHFFSSHYNTAKYLNAEVLEKIDEQMKLKGTSFTFFSETKLFDFRQKPTQTATTESSIEAPPNLGLERNGAPESKQSSLSL